MDRRTVLLGAVSLLTSPRAVDAQASGKVYRVGLAFGASGLHPGADRERARTILTIAGTSSVVAGSRSILPRHEQGLFAHHEIPAGGPADPPHAPRETQHARRWVGYPAAGVDRSQSPNVVYPIMRTSIGSWLTAAGARPARRRASAWATMTPAT
jgi:hypothetical protein